LKIALDEHIGEAIVEALIALSGESKMLRSELVSARKYSGSVKAISDVPWIQKFRDDGGKVIVSGDARMRGKLHEQKALSEAGLVVFFPARPWNNLKVHTKTAMLIRWWPLILQSARSSPQGTFYEIPMSWTGTELKEITPPKRRKPGRKKSNNEDATDRQSRNGSAATDAQHSTAATQASKASKAAEG